MLAQTVTSAVSSLSSETSSLFDTIAIVAKFVLEHGPTNSTAVDAIVRLRELASNSNIKEPELREAIDSLCREAGLFPYMDPTIASTWRERLALELFRGPKGVDYIFHREQWKAFQKLDAGKSLILSAPTSFGKSALIYAFIASKKPQCVVVVVPTIALLDQYRRRFESAFGEDYRVVTRSDQATAGLERKLYVMTQERLLERNDIAEIDLLAIDEYYKLDSGREKQGDGSRATLLNVALRKYLAVAKQVFFLGPTVAAISIGGEFREKFEQISTDFSPVAVNIYDRSKSKSPAEDIANLLIQKSGEKSLVFSKSPPASQTLAKFIATKFNPSSEVQQVAFANWLSENYHPEWVIPQLLTRGVGVHHGSVPRSVAQLLIKLFNQEKLQVLVCTSTLIEGVNTTAKNVFIYDKKISNRIYDYFDFRNIAGRSGRMGEHFVGNVYLFHEPPVMSEVQLEIPALEESSKFSDQMLLGLSDDFLSSSAQIRKRELIESSVLPQELAARMAHYGFEKVQNLSKHVKLMLAQGDKSLLWRGNCGYNELLSSFNILWEHLRFNRAKLSAKEAAFLANRLRVSKTHKEYFERLVEKNGIYSPSDNIDKGFKALLAFDYSIPKVLIDLQDIVNFFCGELSIGARADYSYIAQGLDNQFQHRWTKAFEECGVPMPLGRKLEYLFDDCHTFDDALSCLKNYLATSAEQELSSIEYWILRSALSD